MKNNKIIVILGSTSSGKTGLGVKLAMKFNGEIISADSRQVYKGMDIGTGKDLDKYFVKIKNKNKSTRSFDFAQDDKICIPYHLIDVVGPNTEFNLAKYQKLAVKAVNNVLDRGKLPIIVGGTGLYLQALVDGYNLSAVRPNIILREKLAKLDAENLYYKLEKLDKAKAQKLNNSDRKNKRRLIRYLEIASSPGNFKAEKIKPDYDALIIGLAWPQEVLKDRIYKRLRHRLEKENMIEEVKKLHSWGVSWKRLEDFGLEYKYISLYLQKKMAIREMTEKLNIAIRQFSKKQMTWFRRWESQGVTIHWIKDKKEANKLVGNFLKKKRS